MTQHAKRRHGAQNRLRCGQRQNLWSADCRRSSLRTTRHDAPGAAAVLNSLPPPHPAHFSPVNLAPRPVRRRLGPPHGHSTRAVASRHAELVSLRVGHRHPRVGSLTAFPQLHRTQPLQPGDLVVPVRITDANVHVDAVLRRLRLGHELKVQPGPGTLRVVGRRTVRAVRSCSPSQAPVEGFVPASQRPILSPCGRHPSPGLTVRPSSHDRSAPP